ncbi:23S rRNA (pseudouridine(1915)-N(3))-methyltransferase RlmH [Methyloversatilis thermotolerans]|uniref:23S rRNA (pseudouridine(1915)-N(3))-methyltransferase RlmH n=1 Tax=Methyloversatilis thermotolerans TaxID=1346290 RepID=UPI00039CF0F4|nr:23S rRNA (pseudouridine(1915)-N(3))-methyltransferase RlmH [Methyloversatilis thermotolerans]
MKMKVVCVGHRMPDWVDAGVDEFVRRMPRDLPLQIVEVKAEPRTQGKPVDALLDAERQRIEAAIPARARIVALDERGDDLSTVALAARLRRWRAEGDDVVLLIGGPDGLSPTLKSRAHELIRLSSLTLPHALARLLLAEALYRAFTVESNHPYHRE